MVAGCCTAARPAAVSCHEYWLVSAHGRVLSVRQASRAAMVPSPWDVCALHICSCLGLEEAGWRGQLTGVSHIPEFRVLLSLVVTGKRQAVEGQLLPSVGCHDGKKNRQSTPQSRQLK